MWYPITASSKHGTFENLRFICIFMKLRDVKVMLLYIFYSCVYEQAQKIILYGATVFSDFIDHDDAILVYLGRKKLLGQDGKLLYIKIGKIMRTKCVFL